MNRRHALQHLACVACTAATRPLHAAPTEPGQPVPWPAVTLLDGRRLDPAAWQGRAAVVVFWSTTCPFCRRHNQHVEKLHGAAAGKPLRVLGVARERDADAVRKYAAAQGYSFPITLDTRPLAQVLSTRHLIPLTVSVDRQGRLKQVLPGEMFEEDLLDMLALAG